MYFLRGQKHQQSVLQEVVESKISYQIPVDDYASDSVRKPQTMRNYDDTLIVYATIPGYCSYRDRGNGSWLLQILSEVFMYHAHHRHIEDLLKLVMLS